MIAIFIKAMNEDVMLNKEGKLFKFFTHIGLKDSDFIYIIHTLIGSMLSTAAKVTGIVSVDSYAYKMIIPIVVIVISLLLAEMRNRMLELRNC